MSSPDRIPVARGALMSLAAGFVLAYGAPAIAQVAPEDDPQAWLERAVAARSQGDLETAAEALDAAEKHGLPPVRVGVERARQKVAGGDRNAAVAELRTLFDNGFTAVSILAADSVIGSLEGFAAYDSLVEEMSVQAYPCRHQPGFSDFDFWIGEWDVHIANGTPVGSNVIRAVERGCALTENWTNANGGTGSSVNYLDIASGEWVQIWNAEGGTQIIIRGGLTDDGMAMEGYINYVASGTTAPFRALWTPLPDGRVRQYFEQSSDDGETWAPWFEGFYTRRTAEGGR